MTSRAELSSAAIQRIGGTMPEDIPPVEHIKQVEKRLKNSPPKLKLEDKDAKGLAGDEKNRIISLRSRMFLAFF